MREGLSLNVVSCSYLELPFINLYTVFLKNKTYLEITRNKFTILFSGYHTNGFWSDRKLKIFSKFGHKNSGN